MQRAAAADAFDMVDVHHQRVAVALDLAALAGVQRAPGAARHHSSERPSRSCTSSMLPAKFSSWS
jgi:hypothetical protein